MPTEKRELYRSANGDRWFFAREAETGEPFVRHEANVPSGGHVTDIDIGAFLSEGRRNPEHRALLQLIGTLVDTKPATGDRGPRLTRALRGTPSRVRAHILGKPAS
jgi:hypothetical protein